MAIMRNRRVREQRVEATTGPRVRRQRNASEQMVARRTAEKDLHHELETIGKEMLKIDALQEQIEERKARCQELMKSLGILRADYMGIEASEVEEWTKPQRVVDPKTIYSKLSEKDFLQVITVNLTKLGTLMTDNEIEKIAKKEKAQLKGTKFVVKRLGAKAGKK